MDIEQVCLAFAQSDVTQLIKTWRHDRLAGLSAGEMPIRMCREALVVFHLVPFVSLEMNTKFDIVQSDCHFYPCKENEGLKQNRLNFDGKLFSKYRFDLFGTECYVQVFHNGILEYVIADILPFKLKSICMSNHEKSLVEKIPEWFTHLKNLGVQPPFAIMLSLLGVKDYRSCHLDCDEDLITKTLSPYSIDPDGLSHSSYSIDRDVLMVPEVLLQTHEDDITEILKPAFYTIWNAVNIPRSPNYDSSGSWIHNHVRSQQEYVQNLD